MIRFFNNPSMQPVAVNHKDDGGKQKMNILFTMASWKKLDFARKRSISKALKPVAAGRF